MLGKNPENSIIKVTSYSFRYSVRKKLRGKAVSSTDGCERMNVDDCA